MLNTLEEKFIFTHAYLPEHLVGYVTAVSGAEPFFTEGYLYYRKQGILIFVAYPLHQLFDREKAEKILERVIREEKPARVSLMAPALPLSLPPPVEKALDTYYLLGLKDFTVPQKVRNMIARASRELVVEKGGTYGAEHRELIAQFIHTHDLDEGGRFIVERIPAYLASSETAVLIDARNARKELVAFDVAEFGSGRYAFYMFNVRSQKVETPGASDLLLYELTVTAQEQEKPFLNLGLGINKGITFFKEKWGGRAFMDYCFCVYNMPAPRGLFSLLGRL